MAGFWGKRSKAKQAQAEQDAVLAQKAETAIVAADERIRTANDELVFAEVELGSERTRDLRAALDSVRTHLREAFELHQLNHDEIPDTDEELRTRNARIVQLCDWAEDLLDVKTGELADAVQRVRQAPQIVARVRSDVERLRGRVPEAAATIERLRQRYSLDALRAIGQSAEESDQLLNFAQHGADVFDRRREQGQREEANLALETATEAVRRAGVILDAVEDFEIEALRAESTLAAVVQDSRDDLITARTAPQTPEVAAAVTALDTAVRQIPVSGQGTDPFTMLSGLRAANSALDQAVAKARHRAENPPPPLAHVQNAMADADRQLGIARSLIAGHRGWIGADARTRLAEAERLHTELPVLAADEDTRQQALTQARRVAQLASEALQAAQRDIDSSRPPQDPWGGRGGGGRNGGGMDGLLGGLVIGSILGGIFD